MQSYDDLVTCPTKPWYVLGGALGSYCAILTGFLGVRSLVDIREYG